MNCLFAPRMPSPIERETPANEEELNLLGWKDEKVRMTLSLCRTRPAESNHRHG